MPPARDQGARASSMAEVLGAFAFANDLAFGLAQDDSVRSCYIANRIAEQLRLSEDERLTVYYASLVKDAGCTSWTSSMAALLAGDEIVARREMVIFGGGSTWARLQWLARYVGAELPPAKRVRRTLAFARRHAAILHEAFDTTREVAMRIAGRLGMPEPVQEAVCFVFEQWDGKGMPDGAAGDAIPIASRVIHPTFTLAPVHHRFGRAAAVELARSQRGRSFDPRVADAFLELAGREDFWIELERPDVWELVLEDEPESPLAQVFEAQIDDVALAFADYSDLKSPHILAHSRRVAELAEALARARDCQEPTVIEARRAGLVHDLGLVAVPSWTLGKPEEQMTSAEREQMRMHPYHAERILGRVPALASLAAVAGLHHERMDGQGYYRGLPGGQLPLVARIVALASHFDDLTHEAPGRAALPADEALRAIQSEAGGWFASDVVRALPAALGAARIPRPREGLPAGLTPREVEVLRLAAGGLTRREIARRLRLTENTVRHHLEHIYNKIGVSTRVAAVLFALEQGLLE